MDHVLNPQFPKLVCVLWISYFRNFLVENQSGTSAKDNLRYLKLQGCRRKKTLTAKEREEKKLLHFCQLVLCTEKTSGDPV